MPPLLKFLNRSSATTTEAAQPARISNQRIPRHSIGFQEFSRHIGSQEGLVVLDLGPTSPRNIQYLTSLGHKVYNEDVLMAASDPSLLQPGENGTPAMNVERFFAENLLFRGELFDAVLCWDVPDFLPEELVKPMIERFASVLKPGGVVLGFFHTRDAGPDAPNFRYHITAPDALELQAVPRFRLQRIFNNRNIENLFKGFKSLKFFLARDHIREVLVLR
jgi:SAM-dependent methyltransferase